MYNFSCQILDVVISEGIPWKDKICPVFLRPSAICIWRKGALALCTLTLLSNIDLDYKQCSAPYPDNESRMPLTSITETYHPSRPIPLPFCNSKCATLPHITTKYCEAQSRILSYSTGKHTKIEPKTLTCSQTQHPQILQN